MFAERCEGEYGIENVERFAMMRIEDYTTIASRAAVYTAAILHCKMLVGKSQTLELHPVDADCAIASLIRSNSSQPYIIAHTPDRDVKCRSGHLHLRKQPLHDSFCTGHCSTLFISS